MAKNITIEFNQQVQKLLLIFVVALVVIALVVSGIFGLIGLLYPIQEAIPEEKTSINLSDPSLETTIKDVEKQQYFLFEATVNPNEIGRQNPFEPY
jgi:hypothetical protein